ncbi:lipoate--protein ligase [Luteirhabdus pelagi]|uniref:lipoate--protein ligase n=1 Tax=Luteirhabdus pelagi TaxID=2792783 RepID=UPI00193A13A8|nr:lipoate--protein ligase [Luteirhabdus pelagi]
MVFIENEGINDPHLNLALEEYIVRNFNGGQDYLLFYINEPSIIIGRNQNTLEEINHEYVEEKGIHVVRRVSGGGAVYHDFGNLNFSFITDHDIKSLNNFKKVTAPVVKVLHDMGVQAEMKGRNDVVVDGRKISGNAQFSTGKRMLSHGTLLLDSELGEVANALNVKMSKIQSKGHKSVRSRVANISEFLDEKMDILSFRSKILKGLYDDRDDFETYHLTDTEWKKVHALKEEKYDTWDWNFGRSPKFNIQREKRFDAGTVDLRIFVEKGVIEELTIYGDFFGNQPISDLEDRLVGLRYDKGEIEKSLRNVKLQNYVGAIDKHDFIELLYGADEGE